MNYKILEKKIILLKWLRMGVMMRYRVHEPMPNRFFKKTGSGRGEDFGE